MRLNRFFTLHSRENLPANDMNPPLRRVLAESHIGAVACLVLLWWSLDVACRAFWAPLYRASLYVATAIAIWDIPYSKVHALDKLEFVLALEHFLYAIVYFVAAWMVSRWLFGAGPIRSLRTYSSRWRGRGNG